MMKARWAQGENLPVSTVLGSSTLRRLAMNALILLVILVAAAAVSISAPRVLQPLKITACTPDAFEQNGETCPAGSSVDPDLDVQRPLTLAEVETISVAGRVKQTSDDDVSYSVSVSWISIDATRLGQPGSTFTALSTPLTWEANSDEPYLVDWHVPQEIVDLAKTLPEGSTLGRWRIVGTAIPVRDDKYSTYQWDSVKTFELVAGYE